MNWKGISILLIVSGCLLLGLFWRNQKQDKQTENIRVGDKSYVAEIVSEENDWRKGLGERDSLCPDCAMLFIFPETGDYPFWMKGMRFALDILWIDSSDGKIVHLEKNIPADSQTLFHSPQKADWVLEINAGEADRQGLRLGDTAILE